MNRVWTDNEKAFIENNAGKITDVEGARQLSLISGRPVSVHAWRKQRQKLNIKKSPGRGVCRLATPKLAGEATVLGKDLKDGLVIVGKTVVDDVVPDLHIEATPSPAQTIEALPNPTAINESGNGESMVSEGAPASAGESYAKHNDF